MLSQLQLYLHLNTTSFFIRLCFKGYKKRNKTTHFPGNFRKPNVFLFSIQNFASRGKLNFAR